MGASIPKTECIPNCVERVALTCEERFLKRPEGLKLARVQVQCQEKCNAINEVMSITHVSDAFVSSLSDNYCGGPRGSDNKSGKYSVEIRGTNPETMDSGKDSGTKAQKFDQRFTIVEDMLHGAEQMRDHRIWYQSFSDLLGGPQEPSRRKIDEFRSLLEAAKARRDSRDLDGARTLLEQAIQKGRNAIGEYDRYQIASLDHADRVKWVHLGLSVLLTVGCGATAVGLAAGGSAATAGTVAGGAQVISLASRAAANPVVQETLKRAAMFLFGMNVAKELTSPPESQ